MNECVYRFSYRRQPFYFPGGGGATPIECEPVSSHLYGNRGFDSRRGGVHLYFRLDIILVKGLSKHILNTYFSGMKVDPKYAFLHAFFLICVSCPFQNLSV